MMKLKYMNCNIFLVIIDSGSRYEVAYPSGVSHFLEKLAFNVRSIIIYKHYGYNIDLF